MTSLIGSDDLFDKIEKYYRSSGKLSPKELEICERWELAFSILCAQRQKKLAIAKYLSVLHAKGTKLSHAQAFRDFDAAEKLFTPLKKYTKEFLRLVLIESAMRDVRAAEKKAAVTKDPKMWAEIMKVKDKAEKRIIEASGLNNEDPNMPDFSKLEPSTFNINVDPWTLNMFRKIVTRGSLDITQLYSNMQAGTVDVEHTEED